MIYLDLLYVYSLLREQHVNSGPLADRLNCRISIKMDSQPCGGTIANLIITSAWTKLKIQFVLLFLACNVNSLETPNM